MDVRLAAAKVLLAVDARDQTLATALDDARDRISAADRGLLVELATGVLRWRNALDAVIASASRRSVRTIEPPVLAVLRIGAYQLRHLDRVPPHAVVDTSVRAVRALRRRSAAGLVNAVLRAIVDRGAAISLPARPGPGAHIDAQVNYLATTMSHPAWLVRRWLARMGFEATEAWCRFDNTAPAVTVRGLGDLSTGGLLDALRTAGIAAEPARYVEDAVSLPAGTLGGLPPAIGNRIRAQDEAAQLVARAASVRPGERVLDLCAAPGGKSLVLAADLGGPDQRLAPATLIAADYRPGRVALLARTLRIAHVPAAVIRLDASRSLPFDAIFDCVLLDAPCSGLGTIRREPDLKWSRTPGDLPHLVSVQARMIRAAAAVVRPGGRLVYATCSSEPDENESVVNAFLTDDARFVDGRPDDRRVPADLLDARGRLVTRPDWHGLEAFFAAVLVRREGP